MDKGDTVVAEDFGTALPKEVLLLWNTLHARCVQCMCQKNCICQGTALQKMREAGSV